MARERTAPRTPVIKPPLGQPANRLCRGAERIDLYGWDSPSGTWNGPHQLGRSALADRRLLLALENAPAKSWYGLVNCRTSGGPATRFFVLVHDLSDCAVASIYCDESRAGPAEILAVIPADRRVHLRDDFAFEFLAYARFLGSLSAGAELHVHDAITCAIADPRDSKSLVFSISSGLWPSDCGPVLSSCVGKIAVTLCQWLGGSAAYAKRANPGSVSAVSAA